MASLNQSQDSFINLVNADFTAKKKGLRISEERVVVDASPELPIFSIQLQLSNVDSKFGSAVSGGGDISIEGEVKNGIPHLTRVGNILGEQIVNVSFMSVGRTVRRRNAIMAIGVDEEPSLESLKKIGEVPAIEEFVFLKL
ncbi:hypothetical protein NC651_025833 [Populus alba x Populus x berolinensis]|nr:hypothetical protein NC651_025833 [Populus alba x Populus x berolinensis]